MPDFARLQPETLGAQRRDGPVDHIQHGGRRAKTALQRQIVEEMPGLPRIPFEQQLGSGEILGTGALEPEDRLLEIADGEDGADLLSRLPLAGEKFLDRKSTRLNSSH